MSQSPLCPACNFDRCISLGEMQPVGGQIELKDHGQLYDCPRCHLLFRFPYLTETELIAQYEKLPATKWDAAPNSRPDFEEIRRYLTANFSEGTVLDIGCFRGDLLAELPASWTKLAVEPAEEAAEIARGRGITIVGASLNEAQQAGLNIEMITAVNLAEHLLRPMELIEFAHNTLKPGGVVVISTGNADHWLWKRNRLDYWYNWSDHVVFYRRAWFDWAARQMGLRVVHQANIGHHHFSKKAIVSMATRSFVYEAAKSLKQVRGIGSTLTAVYPLSRARSWHIPPSGSWSKDHFVVVLQKP